MTHEEIKILISAYIDGEATSSEKDIVEEHLNTCQSCQKDYKMYRAMSSSLSKWSNEALSPDEEIKVQRRFEQRREPMFTQRNLMALGTSLALTIIIGSVVLNTYSQRQLQSRVRSSSIYSAFNNGLQERLKSSADDIGDQYSDGNARRISQLASVAGKDQLLPYGEYNKKEAGLASSSSSFLQQAQSPVMAAAGGIYNGPFSAPMNQDRKIIKNAGVTLKVKNAQRAQSDLEDIVTKYNGIIISLNVNKSDDGSRTGTLVFNVLPKDFDTVLRELRKIGEIVSENQTGNDVTNQYTYLQTQLTNYTAVRDNLQKTLKKNMNDPDKSIYLQQEISNVENNMNGVDNNIKNLDLQAYMATITVSFFDTIEMVQPKVITFEERLTAKYKETLKATLETSYNIAINTFSMFVIILSFVFPVVIWSLLFWGIYLLIRRFFKK